MELAARLVDHAGLGEHTDVHRFPIGSPVEQSDDLAHVALARRSVGIVDEVLGDAQLPLDALELLDVGFALDVLVHPHDGGIDAPFSKPTTEGGSDIHRLELFIPVALPVVGNVALQPAGKLGIVVISSMWDPARRPR